MSVAWCGLAHVIIFVTVLAVPETFLHYVPSDRLPCSFSQWPHQPDPISVPFLLLSGVEDEGHC